MEEEAAQSVWPLVTPGNLFTELIDSYVRLRLGKLESCDGEISFKFDFSPVSFQSSAGLMQFFCDALNLDDDTCRTYERELNYHMVFEGQRPVADAVALTAAVRSTVEILARSKEMHLGEWASGADGRQLLINFAWLLRADGSPLSSEPEDASKPKSSDTLDLAFLDDFFISNLPSFDQGSPGDSAVEHANAAVARVVEEWLRVQEPQDAQPPAVEPDCPPMPGLEAFSFVEWLCNDSSNAGPQGTEPEAADAPSLAQDSDHTGGAAAGQDEEAVEGLLCLASARQEPEARGPLFQPQGSLLDGEEEAVPPPGAPSGANILPWAPGVPLAGPSRAEARQLLPSFAQPVAVGDLDGEEAFFSAVYPLLVDLDLRGVQRSNLTDLYEAARASYRALDPLMPFLFEHRKIKNVFSMCGLSYFRFLASGGAGIPDMYSFWSEIQCFGNPDHELCPVKCSPFSAGYGARLNVDEARVCFGELDANIFAEQLGNIARALHLYEHYKANSAEWQRALTEQGLALKMRGDERVAQTEVNAVLCNRMSNCASLCGEEASRAIAADMLAYNPGVFASFKNKTPAGLSEVYVRCCQCCERSVAAFHDTSLKKSTHEKRKRQCDEVLGAHDVLEEEIPWAEPEFKRRMLSKYGFLPKYGARTKPVRSEYLDKNWRPGRGGKRPALLSQTQFQLVYKKNVKFPNYVTALNPDEWAFTFTN